MSYVIDAAAKMHQRQIETVSKGQDAMVDLVKTVADLADRAPKAPEPVQDMIKPVHDVFGSPAELLRLVVENNKEWANVVLDFQAKVVDVVAPATTADTPKTAAKPAAKPAVKAAAKPVAKAEPKPAVKAEPKPAVKAEPKPAVKAEAKPAAKPAAETAPAAKA